HADGPGAIAHCAAQGYAMVTLASSNHTKALVDLAHARGLEARSSGIATRAQMIEAAEMGCNGMTINWQLARLAVRVRARAGGVTWRGCQRRIRRTMRDRREHTRTHGSARARKEDLMTMTGGCHCGAIRYALVGEPKFHALCHCTDCRRHAGAPMVG